MNQDQINQLARECEERWRESGKTRNMQLCPGADKKSYIAVRWVSKPEQNLRNKLEVSWTFTEYSPKTVLRVTI